MITRLLESEKRGDFMTLVPLWIGRRRKIFIGDRLLVPTARLELRLAVIGDRKFCHSLRFQKTRFSGFRN